MKSFKNYIIIASLFIIGLVSQSNDTSLKCGGDTASTYSRGDQAIICIQIKGLNKKIPFQLQVDKYTGLNLKGVYSAIKSQSNYQVTLNSTSGYQLVVQSFKDSIQSDALCYTRQDTSTSSSTSIPYIFPVFSAVIQIQNGNITSIEWDNGCFNGSASSVCKSVQVNSLDSTGKAITYQESNNYVTDCSTNDTDGSCDAKIYISWMGTDVDGNYMTSAGERMSQFLSYSIDEFYQSSKSAFSGISFG